MDINLNIAGLNMSLNGCVYDYVKYRLRHYICDGYFGDIKVTYNEKSSIPEPEGELVAKSDYRIFLKSGSNFINYDVLSKLNSVTALVTADKDWKQINTQLSDVEALGGASLSVRLFNMLGEIFKYALIKRNGFVVHSSSLAYKNNGILFSAPSGTGKSTHTALWEKVYKEDAEIINDDMPAIRKIDGIWNLCGTPWSGKSEKNINKCVPLKAFVFLERGEKNELVSLPSSQGIFRVMNQTLLPVYKELMSEVMDNISDALKNVPCYILKCNISEEAPKIVKEGIINEN